MTNRYMKSIALVSQTIREMQIVFMMRYHLKLFRMVAIRKKKDNECW